MKQREEEADEGEGLKERKWNEAWKERRRM